MVVITCIVVGAVDLTAAAVASDVVLAFPVTRAVEDSGVVSSSVVVGATVSG